MAKHPTLKFVPVGGLDFDSKDSVVAPEDYRDAVNMRNSISYKGQQFVPCNMKGNVLVAYNMTSADCRCLGAIEDKGFNSILYFVWSSDKKHKILRYYPQSTSGPNGEIQLVTEFDFGWKKYERITGIDFIDNKLLYWVDKVKPRMINAVKANNTNKFKEWRVYLPITDVSAYNFQVVVKDITTGISIAGQQINLPAVSREEKFKLLADAINDPNQVLHNYLTAEACDCDLKLTEKAVDSYNVIFTVPNFKIVPENWYGLSLVDRFFDACKYPPGCEPKAIYKADPSINFNFVKDKVFFFRLGYEYDNFESSALGPISNIPVNNQICNEGTYNSFNFIDIDFNDINLLDPNIWVVLKKVGVYVKEHNSGSWLKVGESKSICDFFDLVNGVESARFKFYNNINTSSVSDITTNKQYDNVPIQANSQKFSKNKLTYAGVVEGLDAPGCVEAVLDLDMNDVEQQQYFDVSFLIRICNPGFNGQSNNAAGVSKMPFLVANSALLDGGIINILERRGCIVRHDESSYPVFGGVSTAYCPTNQSGWDQYIPLGGNLVYSAGTNIYGIGRQVQYGGLPTDEFGALLTAGSYSDDIKNYLNSYNVSGLPDAGEIFQTVTLRLPKGKHIIRVASHLCSDGDVLRRGKVYDINNSLYHLTSTNVFRINDPNGNWLGDTEVEIDVTQDQYFGEIFIADRMLPDHDSSAQHLIIRNVYGYLLDIQLFNVVGQVVKCIGIEKQTVALSVGSPPPLDPTSFPCSSSASQITYTDHNGYFFFMIGAGNTTTSAKICAFGAANQIIAGNEDTKYYGDIGQVYDNVLIPQSSPLPFSNNGVAYIYNNPNTQQYYNILGQQVALGSPGYFDITQVDREVLVLNSNPTFRRDYSTIVKGKMVDGFGNGICCVNAVLGHNSRQSNSQTDGDFTILCFADGRHTLTFPAGPNGNFYPTTVQSLPNAFRQEDLVFNSGDCPVTFGSNSIPIFVNPFGTNAGNAAPPYSSTAWLDVGNIVCTLLNLDFIKSAKRGGKYEFVLRYQDAAGRQSSCVKAAEIYIPFFGEDLHDFYPTKYPAGTFSMGSPVITWTIPATFKPPVWASKYQWMRSKNLHQTDYIQWLINDVKYVLSTDETGVPIETVYANFNANQIWISLSNIADFQRDHPGSTVKFEFAVGQRLRFIANDRGDGFKKYIDVLIGKFEENWIKLDYFDDIEEVKTGMLIEATGIKKIDAVDLYYECGECYPCTNPGFDDNAHSVLTAPFTWGDTYWVKRNIPIRDNTDVAFRADLIYFVESDSISDFYLSKDQDLGRVGVISEKFRQINRGNVFRVSNQYIPDTGVNGLCTFDNIDDVELGKEFGPVRSLRVSGFVMAAICENKFVSNYLGAVQGATPNGSLVMASQEGFIGDSRPLIGDFGTQHPATVVEKDGWIWGADFSRGLVWKYDNNGLDTISDKKANSYFNELSKDGIWDAVAGFDSYYQEYILTAWRNKYAVAKYVKYTSLTKTIILQVPDASIYADNDTIEISYVNVATLEVVKAMGIIDNVVGNSVYVIVDVTEDVVLTPYQSNVDVRMRGEGDTIAYHKQKGRWTTRYSYKQDMLCPVGFDFVSWKDGQLMLHDVGPIGTFNGIFYKWILKICAYSQGFPELLWDSIYLEQKQNDQNKVNSWSIPVIDNELGQLSRITKGAFIRLEEFWNAWFRKDLNTTSVPNPIVDGKDLRSSVLNLYMENDSPDKAELRAVNIIVNESSGNR